MLRFELLSALSKSTGNTGCRLLVLSAGIAALARCTPTTLTPGLTASKESHAARERLFQDKPSASPGVESTALMNAGDEVDDNIWVRRPRNRLQPGQSTAPPPPGRVSSEPLQASAETGNPGRGSDLAAIEGGSQPAGDSTLPAMDGLDPPETPGAASKPSSVSRSTAKSGSGSMFLDQPKSAPPSKPSSTPAPKVNLPADQPRPPRTGDDEGKPVWSIALTTFSGDDHRALAENACKQYVALVPALKGAFVRSTGSGSVVMFGQFDGPKDPRAKPELDRLKQMTFGAGRPFARAMLARIEQFSDEEMGPWDLRQVRRLNPNVRVIYTLQIAAWSDLGSGTMTFPEIRRKSEEYCRQLRGEGVQAWYHHDADQLTSIITVGIFGADAYDAQSTLYLPEVEVLRRRFPNTLLNGAEVPIQSDPQRPGVTTPQPTRLVEIPR